MNTRKEAKTAGSVHYAGKVCEVHPELEGKRLTSNGKCTLCAQVNAKKQKADLKLGAIQHYSGGAMCCERCKIDDIDVLTIDHINQAGAQHRRDNGIGGRNGGEVKTGTLFARWLKQNNYPTGYRVLCFNCNMKVWLEYLRGRNA